MADKAGNPNAGRLVGKYLQAVKDALMDTISIPDYLVLPAGSLPGVSVCPQIYLRGEIGNSRNACLEFAVYVLSKDEVVELDRSAVAS